VPCSAVRAPDDPWRDPVVSLCGKPIVVSVAGKDVSAESLCLSHWSLKWGALSVKQPVVTED
jgi:hypothetical protein